MSFSQDFLWGAASAAPQIEGAWDVDGRTPSVWDEPEAGAVRHGENPKIACDHYHLYKNDVALMKQIGLKAYRFSVSWSRVVPRRGQVNKKGIQFYCNLVNELVSAGIEPMVTLYHSDMPVWVLEMGGWDNEEVANAFAEYAEIVVKALSDRVKYWFTLNEPQCFANDCSHQTPSGDINRATRTILLSHGRAVQVIRRYSVQPARVGLVIMGICPIPVEGIMDENAALEMTFSERAGVMGMGWWMDPAILGTVPEALKDTISEADMEVIHQKLDFFSMNSYFPANFHDYPDRTNPLVQPGMPRCQMGNVLDAEVLYYITKFCYQRYELPVLITENGTCMNDRPCLDGKIHDPQRADYIHRYLLALKKAVDEGIPVLGYLYWSIMDNFEWAYGYDVRFGLIYVDYPTQMRLLKDSAEFYREVIESNGENL